MKLQIEFSVRTKETEAIMVLSYYYSSEMQGIVWLPCFRYCLYIRDIKPSLNDIETSNCIVDFFTKMF